MEQNEQVSEETSVESPLWEKLGYGSQEHMEWVNIEGDYFFLRDLALDNNSLVIDIGSYTGGWLKDIYCKYNCFCIGLEPIKKYYDISKRFLTNIDKIKLHNYALTVSNREKTCKMSMIGDASRMDLSENSIDVELVYAKDFFKSIDRDIDVVQINIEGYEYQLVPFLMEHNLLSRVNNIQIQFHNLCPSSKNDSELIISALESLGFKTKFNYPFVWYGGVRE